MPVNPNKSGARLLAVFEQIARTQPIGVRNLAKVLDIEKSAVQRAVITLAEAGWIQSRPAGPTSWELSGKMLHLAHAARDSDSLRQTIRSTLRSLRDQTGETAYFAVPDMEGVVVVEVAESHQPLRLVVPIGTSFSATTSAPGKALLPHLPPEEQEKILGKPPNGALKTALQKILELGYCIGGEEKDKSSVNIASPLLDSQGHVLGVLVICAVDGRTSSEDQIRLGVLLADKAKELASLGRHAFRAADVRRAIGSFG